LGYNGDVSKTFWNVPLLFPFKSHVMLVTLKDIAQKIGYSITTVSRALAEYGGLAVAGFDDASLAEHAHPPLTTVRQPIYEIGQRMCEMLICLLQEETLEGRHVILQPQLIVRESCGAPASQRAERTRR
jgi:DNA-binding LacI/PurR family transcriptional regulator